MFEKLYNSDILELLQGNITKLNIGNINITTTTIPFKYSIKYRCQPIIPLKNFKKIVKTIKINRNTYTQKISFKELVTKIFSRNSIFLKCGSSFRDYKIIVKSKSTPIFLHFPEKKINITQKVIDEFNKKEIIKIYFFFNNENDSDSNDDSESDEDRVKLNPKKTFFVEKYTLEK